jgi:hypothetical protein
MGCSYEVGGCGHGWFFGVIVSMALNRHSLVRLCTIR